MNRVTLILYLIGSALVVGSWLGIVDPGVAWIGWLVATGIALWSWCRRPAATESRDFHWKRRSKPPRNAPSTFTPEEEEAARREVHGDD